MSASTSRLENINDLLDRLATLTRYGCVGPEGDYDAGMEAGAGDYVDGETVSDIVVQLRALLSETAASDMVPRSRWLATNDDWLREKEAAKKATAALGRLIAAIEKHAPHALAITIVNAAREDANGK
jgi:hypothetical protein